MVGREECIFKMSKCTVLPETIGFDQEANTHSLMLEIHAEYEQCRGGRAKREEKLPAPGKRQQL